MPERNDPPRRDLGQASDEDLMCSLRDHCDAEDFRYLSLRWTGRLHRLCYRILGSWQDAEDAVQDIFSNVFQRRHSYQPNARFSTFIWRIAINRCADIKKKNRPVTGHPLEYADMAPTIDNAIENQESAEIVKNAIDQLPEISRTMLLLKHYEGLKLREIADILHVPLGTAASRMASALDRLRVLLVPKLIDNDDKLIEAMKS